MAQVHTPPMESQKTQSPEASFRAQQHRALRANKKLELTAGDETKLYSKQTFPHGVNIIYSLGLGANYMTSEPSVQAFDSSQLDPKVEYKEPMEAWKHLIVAAYDLHRRGGPENSSEYWKHLGSIALRFDGIKENLLRYVSKRTPPTWDVEKSVVLLGSVSKDEEVITGTIGDYMAFKMANEGEKANTLWEFELVGLPLGPDVSIELLASKWNEKVINRFAPTVIERKKRKEHRIAAIKAAHVAKVLTSKGVHKDSKGCDCHHTILYKAKVIKRISSKPEENGS
ncbi:hypothetical protein B0H10DRAFT_2185690 [Mycena sp. CBHHK59/15]|nr:hypothetical protein B0H10DRAFT_2185690 [Mycena sp. CBHHK59/15]